MICRAAALRTPLRAAAASLRPSSQPLLLRVASTLPRRRSFMTAHALRSEPVSGAIDGGPAEVPSMSAAESAIAELLASKLSPSELLVQDISGGCGSMYAIDITSAQFKGQTILKQQRMVNAALGDVMKTWHGVQIRTKVPHDA